MTAERAIHAAVFVLLLAGLCSISAWGSFAYINNNWILRIASITLSWGIILLVLYVSFKKLGWQWWNTI